MKGADCRKKGSLGMEAMFRDCQVATAVAWALLYVKQLLWGGKLAREEMNYQLLGWRVREGLVGWLVLTVLLS